MTNASAYAHRASFVVHTIVAVPRATDKAESKAKERGEEFDHGQSPASLPSSCSTGKLLSAPIMASALRMPFH